MSCFDARKWFLILNGKNLDHFLIFKVLDLAILIRARSKPNFSSSVRLEFQKAGSGSVRSEKFFKNKLNLRNLILHIHLFDYLRRKKSTCLCILGDIFFIHI